MMVIEGHGETSAEGNNPPRPELAVWIPSRAPLPPTKEMPCDHEADGPIQPITDGDR